MADWRGRHFRRRYRHLLPWAWDDRNSVLQK